jgi:hypothetical protein
MLHQTHMGCDTPLFQGGKSVGDRMTYPQVFESLLQGLHHLYDPNYLEGSSAATQPRAVHAQSRSCPWHLDFHEITSRCGARTVLSFTRLLDRRMAGVMPPVSHRAITHFDEHVTGLGVWSPHLELEHVVVA